MDSTLGASHRGGRRPSASAFPSRCTDLEQQLTSPTPRGVMMASQFGPRFHQLSADRDTAVPVRPVDLLLRDPLPRLVIHRQALTRLPAAQLVRLPTQIDIGRKYANIVHTNRDQPGAQRALIDRHGQHPTASGRRAAGPMARRAIGDRGASTRTRWWIWPTSLPGDSALRGSLPKARSFLQQPGSAVSGRFSRNG